MKRSRPNIEENEDWVNYIITDGTNVYSGVTNNLARRLKQHKTQRGSLRTRKWAALTIVATIRGTPKTLALALERKLKQTIVRGGGICGRIKAIIKLTQDPAGFQSKALGHVSHSDLQRLTIATPMSQSQVLRLIDQDAYAPSDLSLHNWTFETDASSPK